MIKELLWQNPTPSSPRYCRPIRIQFIKESTDMITKEIQYVEDKIRSLQESRVSVAGKNLTVKHAMLFKMIDGKIYNAATETTCTMKCYICGATSKNFNDLSKTKEIDPETLKFGLSVVHARIRLFETLLHLSYKLPVKKWQLRSESEKAIAKERKLNIQKAFRERMGLIVDVPKPGFGNTNDGNSSRRFFIDSELATEITGVDSQLIYRFRVIWETISSGFKVSIEKFSSYTMDTAKLYIQLCPWYPMTPTVHKILIHGPTVIEKALLPIGQLSEHFRLFRQNYARKFSRKSCNLDVLNRLLLSSDPVLTGMTPIPRKKSNLFLKETIEMLLGDSDTQDSCSHDEEDVAEVSSDEEPWTSSSD